MTLKFYASVAKGLKLKDRKFWELIPTFVKVTREKMAGGAVFVPPILKKIKGNVVNENIFNSFPLNPEGPLFQKVACENNKFETEYTKEY